MSDLGEQFIKSNEFKRFSDGIAASMQSMGKAAAAMAEALQQMKVPVAQVTVPKISIPTRYTAHIDNEGNLWVNGTYLGCLGTGGPKELDWIPGERYRITGEELAMLRGYDNSGKTVTRDNWPNTNWGTHIDENGNRVPNKPPPKKIKRTTKPTQSTPRKVKRHG